MFFEVLYFLVGDIDKFASVSDNLPFSVHPAPNIYAVSSFCI
jgi:hypothetical protein